MGMKQRVNFFRGVKGGEERSSRRYWVEKCSTDNCFLKFFIVPGEIRKGLNELVPSAWSERESEVWCYGEGDLDRELCIEREIELYKLKRNYNELRERLEGVNIIKYLPVEREIEEYFNNIFINDNNLPDVIVEELSLIHI